MIYLYPRRYPEHSEGFAKFNRQQTGYDAIYFESCPTCPAWWSLAHELGHIRAHKPKQYSRVDCELLAWGYTLARIDPKDWILEDVECSLFSYIPVASQQDKEHIESFLLHVKQIHEQYVTKAKLDKGRAVMVSLK